MTLLILDLDTHPLICDEVVGQTREYRRRPLGEPIFPPHPQDTFNADVHIQKVQSQLRKLVSTLPQSEAAGRGAKDVSSPLNDWVERTEAVFHTRDGLDWMCSCTHTSIYPSTMVSKIYIRVLDELVQDITALRDEAYSACWPGTMPEEMRDITRTNIRLRLCAVFVSPAYSCVPPLCARRAKFCCLSLHVHPPQCLKGWCVPVCISHGFSLPCTHTLLWMSAPLPHRGSVPENALGKILGAGDIAPLDALCPTNQVH